MLSDLRNLEARYSLNNYPYADNEYSQDRLRALGIATDQLITPPKNPAPEASDALISPPEPPVEMKTEGMSKHLPLLLGALLVYLWFKTK